jgi:hypothetical protein
MKKRYWFILQFVSFPFFYHGLFWLEKLNGRDNLEDLGIYVKIILEWILEK